MNAENVNIFPTADGVLFLKDKTDASAGLLDFCGKHTFGEIRCSPYAQDVDIFRTKLLYRQLAPAPFRYQPNRFENDLKDDRIIRRAIHKYKHKYPDTICVYSHTSLKDDALPEFAKAVGVRVKVRPYFQRIGCRRDEDGAFSLRFYGRPPKQLISCESGSLSKDFDIVYNKPIWVMSQSEVPGYRRASQELQRLCADTKLSAAKRRQSVRDYLQTCTHAERVILSHLLFEASDGLDVRSALSHEIKHVINDILLSVRRAEPTAGKLNAEQMRLLFVHDELSASTQEILTAFEQIYQGNEPDDASEFAYLVPAHYMKYRRADKAQKAHMLRHPQSIVRELIPNWLRHHYDYYQQQFRELFGHLPRTYPQCQWTSDEHNDPKEYELQKRLLYTIDVLDPRTGKRVCFNCADLVKDSLFPPTQGLQEAVVQTQQQYQRAQNELRTYGITPQILHLARQRHFLYRRHNSHADSSCDHFNVERVFHKYAVSAGTDGAWSENTAFQNAFKRAVRLPTTPAKPTTPRFVFEPTFSVKSEFVKSAIKAQMRD